MADRGHVQDAVFASYGGYGNTDELSGNAVYASHRHVS